MRKWIISAAATMVIAVGIMLYSQTPKHLAWDQVAANLAEAQGLSYKFYADGSPAGAPLTGVTCSGTTSPFLCVTVGLPTLPPGNHTLTLTAVSADAESAQSNSVSISVPQSPGNVRKQ